MKEFRRVWLHVLLLAAAAIVAFVEAQPKQVGARTPQPTDVEVWSGKPSAVRLVTYETPKKTVTLEARSDALGSYYLGSEQRVSPGGADAGAPPAPTTFVSVGAATKLVEKLAPLIASRDVGTVAEERFAAFGLDKPGGTLRVQVSQTEYVLDIGGPVPARSDRYVRNTADGKVYAIEGSIVSDLEGGASRLQQRELHAFRLATTTITSVRIKAGDKVRELVRGGPEGRRFWADQQTPEEQNETAANWLEKLERLAPQGAREDKPDEELVVRVEYLAGKDLEGYAELHRVEGEYFVTSELLRVYAAVPKATAEQIAQDLASVVP